VHQLLVRCGDDEDPYDRRIDLPGTEYWEKPYHFLGQGQRKTIQRMNLVKWSNDPVLYEAIDFWGKIKSALYSTKAPTPGANEAVELFFEWIGMNSWTNIKGVPGYKSHKTRTLNFDLFLDPAKVGHQARKEFLAKISDPDGSIICEVGKGRQRRGLRSQVYALYMWLQNTVVDPVKPVAASTVYKAQGNSIKQVMIDLEDLYKSRHYGDKGGENAARALYTAVSRASEKLYIVVSD
jgi:hypothetical protein